VCLRSRFVSHQRVGQEQAQVLAQPDPCCMSNRYLDEVVIVIIMILILIILLIILHH